MNIQHKCPISSYRLLDVMELVYITQSELFLPFNNFKNRFFAVISYASLHENHNFVGIDDDITEEYYEIIDFYCKIEENFDTEIAVQHLLYSIQLDRDLSSDELVQLNNLLYMYDNGENT